MNLRAWLVLSRGSNLPTVWSSTMAGWLLGAYWSVGPFMDAKAVAALVWWPLPCLLLAVSAIYVGGMILNDVFDAEWDARHRPSRPIPSGQVSADTAHLVGFSLLLAGAAGAVLVRLLHARSFAIGSPERLNDHVGEVAIVAGLLVAAVLVYDRWHKGVVWAPLVMGLCRALLPILGLVVAGISFGSMSWDGWAAVLLCCSSLWLLTFTLTWVARHEATDARPPAWTAWVIYLVPLPGLVAEAFFGGNLACVLPAVVVYGVWIRSSDRRHPLPAGVPGRVSDRLAASPFLDYFLLSAVVRFAYLLCYLRSVDPEDAAAMKSSPFPPLSLLAIFGPLACFGLTLLFRRWIPQT
jgi:4-hydroxybenzoate polyprenyltransferase